MTLLRRPDAEASGRYQHITPENAAWKYVGFDAYELVDAQCISLPADDDMERCLVILSGKADIAAGDDRFKSVGERASVFDEMAPHAVYVPNGIDIEVTARGALELAVCSAPGKGNHPTRWIKPDEMGRETRGTGSNTRQVQLSAAQARYRRYPPTNQSGRDLLSPLKPIAGFRLPTCVYR